MKKYQDLDMLELFLEAHKASFLLPKYELYELGAQVRRSADSINYNIVEDMAEKIQAGFSEISYLF